MQVVRRLSGVVFLLATLLFGARLYGQGGATGAIAGSVLDTTGAPISGADVQIINASTNSIVRKLPTNNDGDFVATLLPPGTYIVVVNKSGFGEAKAQGIEVRVTETTRELPLATQNYQQLLSLSAGTQSELNASAQLGRGNVRIIVNGQREDNNNYLIEGISATDYNVAQATYVPLPNPDVIQEFKVQTSLYDASQGRNGGGNVNAIL